MKKNWFQMVVAYLTWALFIALGVFTLITGRNSLLAYLSGYFIQTSFQRAKQADLIHQAFFLTGGLVLFILIIVVEEYFKNGAKKGLLPRRLARVFGFEVLAFFLANLAMAVMVGFPTLVTVSLVAEILISALLLWLGYRKTPSTPPASTKI